MQTLGYCLYMNDHSYARHSLRRNANFMKNGGMSRSVSEPTLLSLAKFYGLADNVATGIIDDVFGGKETRASSHAEQLMAAEDLGRRIAQALEPLGLSPEAIQAAAAFAADEGRKLNTVLQSRIGVQRHLMRDEPKIAERYARAAGVATYFEKKAENDKR